MRNLVITALLLVTISGCEALEWSDVKTWPGIENGEGGTLGALGCSMTRDLFDPGLSRNSVVPGWRKLSPSGAKVLKSYSGGTLLRWAEGNNIKWAAFEAGDAGWPDTFAILWQICIQEEEVIANPNDYLDELAYIANRIQQESPGVPIYVTGMPRYTGGHVCYIAGPDGVEFSHTLAALAAQSTPAILADGLELGPFSASQTKDGCHVTAAGAAIEAAQLEAWILAL